MLFYLYLFDFGLYVLFLFLFVKQLQQYTQPRATEMATRAASNKPLSFMAKIRRSPAIAIIKTMLGIALSESEAKAKAKEQVLACPICYDTLIWNGDPAFSVDSTPRSILKCSMCKKSYSGNETHLDLTVDSGTKKYGEYKAASIELFRLPIVSFLYERGWRQAFSIWGGYPGPHKEYEMMKGYLNPVKGGTIIDASCGSGMFSRRFQKSGLFSLVVALDYSESMLKQCYDFIKEEENISNENLILVRADIGRLPFASNSIDAVHAGAALHCWPSLSAGVVEINRILRPGGVFVATTFIVDGPYSFIPFLSPMREILVQASGSRIFLSERELKKLCKTCGLVDFTCVRNRRFVMISARKPA